MANTQQRKASTIHTEFDIFISYRRSDNKDGFITALRDAIIADQLRFSTILPRVFFDTQEIYGLDGWRHRIKGALRSSKILVICLSPRYFASDYCRWEWDEYQRYHAHQILGDEGIAIINLANASTTPDVSTRQWLEAVYRKQVAADLQQWFPDGPTGLRQVDAQNRLSILGQRLHQRLDHARRAFAAPGNMPGLNPRFVNRVAELRSMKEQLQTGIPGQIAIIHGLGGVGKTEVVNAYAHSFAADYPGGRWLLPAEGHTELLILLAKLRVQLDLPIVEDEKLDATWRRVIGELRTRSFAARNSDPSSDGQPNPDAPAAALLILDNVDQPKILSAQERRSFSFPPWLHILATTRLAPSEFGGGLVISSKVPDCTIDLDVLGEADAAALLQAHQPNGKWPTDDCHDFALRIVQELQGFTLAIEQVAVYLGLNPEVHPRDYLIRILREGVGSTDHLISDNRVSDTISHRGKQVAAVLDETCRRLSPEALATPACAALYPSDTIPRTWLRNLVGLGDATLSAPGFPDPWLSIERQLEGLRLVSRSTNDGLWRMHPIIAEFMRNIDSDIAEREDRIKAFNWLKAYEAQVEPTQVDREDQLVLLAVGQYLVKEPDLNYLQANTLCRLALTFEGPEHALDPRSLSSQAIIASQQNVGDLSMLQGDLYQAAEDYVFALQQLRNASNRSYGNGFFKTRVAVINSRIGLTYGLLRAHGWAFLFLQRTKTALEHLQRSGAITPAGKRLLMAARREMRYALTMLSAKWLLRIGIIVTTAVFTNYEWDLWNLLKAGVMLVSGEIVLRVVMRIWPPITSKAQSDLESERECITMDVINLA